MTERLIAAGQSGLGEPDILIVTDAGYDITRLAYVLRDLQVELLGRIRSDRVLLRPAPSREKFMRASPYGGRPHKHGGQFALWDPATWPSRDRDRHQPLWQCRGRCLGPAASPHRQHPATAQPSPRRRPWEKPAPAGRPTPARVRRGFRDLRPALAQPAGAPKPSKPGPGRPRPGGRSRCAMRVRTLS
ncbi:transposase [Nonomuraea typhae]|uniref:transposase n=1 Tax=Nonomuraea typhae TaxID=2603600 RepID=UPI003CCE4887